MQLKPRYGTVPIISLDGDPASIARPAIRQRQRLVEVLGGFDAHQWAHPSRCAGWSAKDVIIHLDSTNSYWVYSINAGLRGEPTTFMASFDPVASPAALVAASPEMSDAHVLETFAASTDAFVQLMEQLDGDDWLVQAEAPPGHIAVSAVAHHALWDSWIHERDILAPLGIDSVEEPDEVRAALRYAAGLSPAFSLLNDGSSTGSIRIVVTEPDCAIEVVVADDGVHVRAVDPDHVAPDTPDVDADAVTLLEALSLRRPFDGLLPDDAYWMFQGVLDTFDAS